MAGSRVCTAVTPCLPALQSSADKALDRTGEPLADWAALKSDLRITKRIKFLQRCGPGSLELSMPEHEYILAECAQLRAKSTSDGTDVAR